MNIAFTGTNDHASLSTIMATENPNRTLVSHKILCTLNDKGEKDAYNFENLLDEFKYSKDPKDKNKIMVEVINDITDEDAKILLKQDLKKVKTEYAPICLGVRINGKPVNVFRNNLYIFQKLQKLADDITKIRPIDLLFEKKNLTKTEVLVNMFGDIKLKGKKKELLSPCFKPENIQFNAASISTSLRDVIMNLSRKR